MLFFQVLEVDMLNINVFINDISAKNTKIVSYQGRNNLKLPVLDHIIYYPKRLHDNNHFQNAAHFNTIVRGGLNRIWRFVTTFFHHTPLGWRTGANTVPQNFVENFSMLNI